MNSLERRGKVNVYKKLQQVCWKHDRGPRSKELGEPLSSVAWSGSEFGKAYKDVLMMMD